jgi:hypothetical protein
VWGLDDTYLRIRFVLRIDIRYWDWMIHLFGFGVCSGLAVASGLVEHMTLVRVGAGLGPASLMTFEDAACAECP